MKIERMHHPEDTLAKRQSAYACDVMHEFNGFPGVYIGPCVNEYPDAGGSVPRLDSPYLIELDGEK